MNERLSNMLRLAQFEAATEDLLRRVKDEEELNQLEKQKQEMWWHNEDQDDQAIEGFCNER